MLQINQDTKQKLAEIEDFSEFFTDDEFKSWVKLIAEKHNDNNNLIKKVLGVAYIPAVNYATQNMLERPEVLTQLGLKDKSDEYITSLAFVLYKEEDFKSQGDEEVTEALNFFEFEDGETIKSYWALSA